MATGSSTGDSPSWVRAGARAWEAASGAGEAEIWMCATPVRGAMRAELERCLCSGEREQVGRFLLERDRELYLAAHGLLRLILGVRTGTDPLALQFRNGRWGKPELARGEGREAPWFNIAHSGSRVLVALCAGHPVGVDVERHRPLKDALQIADRFFGPSEITLLREAEGEEREDLFFRLWTRKEAVVKAAGLSIAVLSRELDLSRGGRGASGLAELSVPDSLPGSPPAELWWEDLPMEPGYSAAAATAGARVRPALRDLGALE